MFYLLFLASMKDRYDMMSPSSSISSSPETLYYHRLITDRWRPTTSSRYTTTSFECQASLLPLRLLQPTLPDSSSIPSFYQNLYSSAAGPASMPAFPPVNMLSRTVATPSESDATSSEEHLRPSSLGHNYYGHRFNPHMLPRHSTDPKPSSL